VRKASTLAPITRDQVLIFDPASSSVGGSIVAVRVVAWRLLPRNEVVRESISEETVAISCHTEGNLLRRRPRQDQLEGKIQERYDLAKDQAKKDVEAWFRSIP